MKYRLVFLFLFSIILLSFDVKQDSNILSYEVNLNTTDLKFYWKNSEGNNYYNFLNLKKQLAKEEKKLVFAMNGGMYMPDGSPQGLYIENGVELSPLDTVQEAFGNFYMQPNGIFYITKENKPVVCKSTDFIDDGNVKFATQSGPMLLIDGKMHPKFKQGSIYLNIRNGVGVLPNGNLLFAMSKTEVNFHDFAIFFASQGCENALYLDGYVSRVYLPSKNWKQFDGNFGVIIGEVK